MRHIEVIAAAALVVIAAALMPQSEATDTCQTAGYHKSSGNDPAAFHLCVYSARRWLLFQLKCGAGNMFSDAQRRCMTAPATTTTTKAPGTINPGRADFDFNEDEGENENEEEELADGDAREGRALALEVTSEPCPCVDTCPTTGYFQSCCKNEKFFYCIWNSRNNRWLLYPLSCKPGYEFDDSKQTCVLMPASR